jgi:hypothetical protein
LQLALAFAQLQEPDALLPHSQGGGLHWGWLPPQLLEAVQVVQLLPWHEQVYPPQLPAPPQLEEDEQLVQLFPWQLQR